MVIFYLVIPLESFRLVLLVWLVVRAEFPCIWLLHLKIKGTALDGYLFLHSSSYLR